MTQRPDPLDLAEFLRERLGLAPDDELEIMNPYRRALRALTELRPVLADLENVLVDPARLAGSTWDELARDLGISRPTAHRRHAQHDPIATRRRRDEWSESFGPWH